MQHFYFLPVLLICILQSVHNKRIRKQLNFLSSQHPFRSVNNVRSRNNSCKYQLKDMVFSKGKKKNGGMNRGEGKDRKIKLEGIKRKKKKRVFMQKHSDLSKNLFELYDESIIKTIIVARELALKSGGNKVLLKHMLAAIFKLKCYLVNKVLKKYAIQEKELLAVFEILEGEGAAEKREDTQDEEAETEEKNKKKNKEEKEENREDNNEEKKEKRKEKRKKEKKDYVKKDIGELFHKINFSTYCKLAMKKAINISAEEKRHSVGYVDMLQAILECAVEIDGIGMSSVLNKTLQCVSEWKRGKNKEEPLDDHGKNMGNITSVVNEKKNKPTDTPPFKTDGPDRIYDVESDESIDTETVESSDNESKGKGKAGESSKDGKRESEEEEDDWYGHASYSKDRAYDRLSFYEPPRRNDSGYIVYGNVRSNNAYDSKNVNSRKGENFLTNMNVAAMEKGKGNFFGRKKELRKIIAILGRKKKSNPLLIGNSGVGKTSVVEHLAYLIVNKKVPKHLKGCTIYQLSMNDVVAGTHYRGMFEENLKEVLQIIGKTKKAILFIDEIHTLRGAGKGEGTLDASNIMKPFLSSDDFQCIGATTWDEYTKYLEKDGAIKRRFANIVINELSSKDTYLLLQKIQRKYEKYHNVYYTESALKAIINLSEQYLPNMSKPDNAIELLDDAGVYQKIKCEKFAKQKKQEETKENKNIITDTSYRGEKTGPQVDTYSHQSLGGWTGIYTEDNKSYHTMTDTNIKNKEQNVKQKSDGVNTQKNTLQELYGELHMKYVTSDVIETIVSERSSVKFLKRNDSRNKKILQLKEKLNKNVIGQEKAMDIIAQYFLKAITNISDPDKPIGTILLCGSTGVGKTLCARVLSDYLFQKNKLIVINMSEYSESHSVSKLYGTSPGYVGYDDGGQLTEAVRRNPFSIILFDEIEKAHPRVLTALLRILDEGSLTDGRGQHVSFKNTFLIMTSNVGSELIADYFKIYNNNFQNLGFRYYVKNKIGSSKNSAQVEEEKKKLEENIFTNRWYDELQPEIEEELKKHFLPEFLNRIDEKVVFRQFLKADVIKILTNNICLLKKRLKKRKNLNLIIYKSVTKYLHGEIPNLYDMTYGARSIKRVVQTYIENPIANFLINNCYEPNDSIVLKMSPAQKIMVELQSKIAA